MGAVQYIVITDVRPISLVLLPAFRMNILPPLSGFRWLFSTMLHDITSRTIICYLTGLFRGYSNMKHSTGTVLNQAGLLFVWSSTGEFLGHTVESSVCFDIPGGCVEAKGNLACCSSGPLNMLCGAWNMKLDTLTDEWICTRIMTCIVLYIFFLITNGKISKNKIHNLG